ncbi:hypothetical protein MmazTMA_02670 [Methanosarcina mazei]|nr:hypothetical protein MmazTMA_02670 [Methanosarcina mazei]
MPKGFAQSPDPKPPYKVREGMEEHGSEDIFQPNLSQSFYCFRIISQARNQGN